MPMLTPHVSDEVLQAITRAEVMHGYIQNTLPDSMALDSDEKILIVGLLALVEEHHGAILYLLRTGQYDGSAFGLARPLIDAAYRAHWIYCCAKPATVKRIKEGGNCYPGLINMAENVEKRMDAGGFFTSIAPYINTLHGFTHGGLEQLGRRFDENGNVSATYADAEKLEVIKSTTAHLTALAIAWCQITSDAPHDEEPRSQFIMSKQIEIFGQIEQVAPETIADV